MELIDRSLGKLVRELLSASPAVGLLGPRQVGKSTLSRLIAEEGGGLVIDLQRPEARTQLADPTAFLRANAERLIVVDEVQRQPAIFAALRPIIDEDRRPGRFLLTGSASPELMRDANESLAGRIFYAELPPLSLPEVSTAGVTQADHHLAGGYPQPLLQLTARQRTFWHAAYLSAFVTRDLAELGVRTNTVELERLLTMLAHGHGGLFNASALAGSLRITAPTVQRYVDLLEAAFLLRVLRPHHSNLGKRLARSPRVYWRDTGLLHGLLGIHDHNDLLLHPSLGASWEGYAIEEVCRAANPLARVSFYRTHGGAELDLVTEVPGGVRLAFEMKFSRGAALTRGTYAAIADVAPRHTYVVVPDGEPVALSDAITLAPLAYVLAEVRRAVG